MMKYMRWWSLFPFRKKNWEKLLCDGKYDIWEGRESWWWIFIFYYQRKFHGKEVLFLGISSALCKNKRECIKFGGYGWMGKSWKVSCFPSYNFFLPCHNFYVIMYCIVIIFFVLSYIFWQCCSWVAPQGLLQHEM